MADDVVLVIDCGTTNVVVAAVDATGDIAASVGKPNGPVPQPGGEPGWLVWDLDALWRGVCDSIREVTTRLAGAQVDGITVTTWGADGAPVTAAGELTYPVIAWECARAEDVARRVAERVGARRLFEISAYQVIPFNTIFKLVWLHENSPEALADADAWMMTPGLLSHRLCGEMSVDVTIASTTMLLDLRRGVWSDELLAAAGVEASFFPRLVYPGEVIGRVTGEAARQTGLPEGTPVVAAGHDTQFAPFGAGTRDDEALVSTGTWEIAMLRTPEPVTDDYAFEQGILTEADAVRGMFDPQLLMMGSGVLEWVRGALYGGIGDRAEAYATMIGEAAELAPGAGGVTMAPCFVPSAGPGRQYNTAGTILGLALTTTRAQVYRAALEGLCFQLRQALAVLSRATGFSPAKMRVVGGGSRNELWNRMRADVCRLPVVVTERKEATVVGAAIAAWVGAGLFESFPEGERQIDTPADVIQPSDDAGRYDELFERYELVGPALKGFYAR